MRWVSSAQQVRALDAATIEGLGVPGFALMEVAARGVAMHVRANFAVAARQGTVVVCGGGNNGGDGYAIARWLHGWGWPVRVVATTPNSRGDAGTNRALCDTLGIAVGSDASVMASAGLIIDAVFGTGLDRPVTGPLATLLSSMGEAPAPVIAVDLPSGLHADTGQPLGPVPPAAVTVTFGRLKPGLLLAPGVDLCGRVEVVDIGLGVAETSPSVVAGIPEASDLADLWPRRKPGDHKSRSGHLLVVAGSPRMAGAAVLCCRAGLRAGAGLVTLAVSADTWPRLAALPPEVMVTEWSDALDLGGFSAIAAGPGLGGGRALAPDIRAWLGRAWASDLPAVYDADALGSVDGKAGARKVLTPHPGEASRLLGCSAAEVEADRFHAAHALAKDRVALLKGRNTIVALGGAPLSINPTGASTLATAGSGDVLTGVIGALLARGLTAWDAARLGAWVHGRSGELLHAQNSVGWTAGDVADRLPVAIDELLRCGD